MARELKVQEFDRKSELVAFVNKYADKLEIQTITSTQVAVSFRHFLWYYEK